MATREVYPTAAIYAVCSVFFSGLFVWMRRSPTLRLTSVWATFVAYNVRSCVPRSVNIGVITTNEVSVRDAFPKL